MLPRRALGLRDAARSRPSHRQFTTFLSSPAINIRPRARLVHNLHLRQIHARAISYSAIPKFVAGAFRVPVAGLGVGAGAVSYANYKYEGAISSTKAIAKTNAPKR